ncbi:MAG: CDP-alcohol phosphatidyltransferase family protein [Pseudomonadota bacterium]
MTLTQKAYAVHALTASGAVFAMLAMLSAVNGNWSAMFLWLLVALFVDGIDGPLARKFDVKENAPIIDGALLDLIIDYLTYVFIPAFALFYSGMLTGWAAWFGLIAIVFSAGLYFADTRMKTKDNSFMGFPGCFNMAVLVLFATMPPEWIILSAVTFLSAAQFLPLKFVHPTRTIRWRNVTLPMAVLWLGTGVWAAATAFTQPVFVTIVLSGTSLYLMFAGIIQELVSNEEPAGA